jgi:hypothetical protein
MKRISHLTATDPSRVEESRVEESRAMERAG